MKLLHDFLIAAIPNAYVRLGAVRCPLHEAMHLLAPYSDDARDVSIDSRTLGPGDVFLALPGERVDGHDFVTQALKQGAGALIVSREDVLEPDLLRTIPVIIVDDTLATLQALARTWRERFTIPIVGITGSIGKTTTKEMVRSVLETAGKKACVSRGNQNSTIGLPLNLLSLSDEHEVGVFEVGINAPGEMEQLVALLQPTLGLIIGVAHAHGQYLGNIESIALEKKKLFSQFSQHSIGVVPGDQEFLGDVAYPHPVVRFGCKHKNHVHARQVQLAGGQYVEFALHVYDEVVRVQLHTPNQVLLHNALGAAALTHLLEVGVKDIARGLCGYTGFTGRFEVRPATAFDGLLINDCYNASPESMKGALCAFDAMPGVVRKIAVLGDMLELGEREEYWHRSIGRVLQKLPSLTHLVLVGPRAKFIAKTAPLGLKKTFVDTWQQAQEVLERLTQEPSLVLLKASNGVGLTNLVPKFS